MGVTIPKARKAKNEVTEYTDGSYYVLERKGHETVVSVSIDGLVGIGKSVCNPIDVYNERIGEEIASARAFQNLGKQVEELWISRAVTKEDYRKRHPNKTA